MNKPEHLHPEISLVIERFNAKGRGVGFYQRPQSPAPNQVEVFCALPSDEVKVELGSRRHGKYQGRLKEVLKASPVRVKPRCQHVGECGGCTWQQMSYHAQLTQSKK